MKIMKRNYIIMLLLAASAMGSGCKKSFLDAKPTSFTTPEQLGAAAKQDPALLDGSITGLYTTMFTDGMGGTTGHDDFGQKGIDIYTDMLQSDMVLAGVNYGWYTTIANYTAPVNFTTNPCYIPFRYYYRQVFGANTLIDILGGDEATPTGPGAYTFGQAKAMRAYAYFYLSQLYAKGYGDGSEKILPIYKSAKTEFVNQPKSKASDVWDFMVKDLRDAIVYLNGFTRAKKNQVDINVARGLLAYVLAARGTAADWAEVETLTAAIMAAYPKTTAAYVVYNGTNGATAGFNNSTAPAWMWGVDLTLDQGINLISWFGQVDVFTYSYAWAGDPKTIDRGLYDAIRTDDIRKGQFNAPNQARPLYPTQKIFDKGRVIGGARYVTSSLIYMRSDEFYMLNVEAKANQNKDVEARTALASYLSDRITDLSYLNSLSGDDLKNEIYKQTRIEFWGEGKSYLAMKRGKRAVVRGSNHLFFANQAISADDPRLTFEIPQQEVLNNPNLNK